jgi:hypothetical protein
MFDHDILRDHGDPVAHLPTQARDAFGPTTASKSRNGDRYGPDRFYAERGGHERVNEALDGCMEA